MRVGKVQRDELERAVVLQDMGLPGRLFTDERACRSLVQNGLARLSCGHYYITPEGRAFIKGELDVRLLDTRGKAVKTV